MENNLSPMEREIAEEIGDLGAAGMKAFLERLEEKLVESGQLKPGPRVIE